MHALSLYKHAMAIAQGPCFHFMALTCTQNQINASRLIRGDEQGVQIHFPRLFHWIKSTGSDTFAVAYNHPSGNHALTQADMTFTSQLEVAAQKEGVLLIMTMVLSPKGFALLATRDA